MAELCRAAAGHHTGVKEAAGGAAALQPLWKLASDMLVVCFGVESLLSAFRLRVCWPRGIEGLRP